METHWNSHGVWRASKNFMMALPRFKFLERGFFLLSFSSAKIVLELSFLPLETFEINLAKDFCFTCIFPGSRVASARLAEAYGVAREAPLASYAEAAASAAKAEHGMTKRRKLPFSFINFLFILSSRGAAATKILGEGRASESASATRDPGLFDKKDII
jgi:hypothetical protein